MTIGQKLLVKFLEAGLLICLTVFACDVVPTLLTWVKRIHIGRFADEKAWRAAAQRVAKKWAKKLPPMPVSDQTAYTIFPRLKGKYSNRAFTCWQEACLLLGLEGDEQALRDAKAFFVKADVANREYTVGNAMLIYALMKNGCENDETVKAAADKYCREMLALAGEGTLPYNPGGSNRFVDTLGMACPFLIKYHLAYGCPEALALAKRQIDEYYEYGVHAVTGLPVHCFNFETKAPLGIYGWGRGCGWLAIALAECYEMLEGKDKYAAVLKHRIWNFAVAVSLVQRPDGGFCSINGADLRTALRTDSSATAILGWFLYRACIIYDNNESLLSHAQACKTFVMSVTRTNGEVDFAQGDTIGVGDYSRRFEPLPAAQGFALRIGR